MTAQHAPEFGAGPRPHEGPPLFHRDLRTSHRFLAASFTQLAQYVGEDARSPYTGAEDRSYLAGYQAALIDLAHHLEAGDYLPGGLLNCADLPA